MRLGIPDVMVVRADKTPVIAVRFQHCIRERLNVWNVSKASFFQRLLEIAVEICHIKRNGC